MRNTSKRLGTKHYIGVDLFEGHSKELLPLSFDSRAYSIQDDLLLCAASIPPNRVNITINGVDNIIIPNPEYHEVLATEIRRICRVGGIVFGTNSKVLNILKEQIERGEIEDFKIVTDLDTSTWSTILEKITE